MRRMATVVAVVLTVSGCGSRVPRDQMEAANGSLAPAAAVDAAAPVAAAPDPSAPAAGGVETTTGVGTITPGAAARQGALTT
ncbi:MAG: hypothetical protein ACRDZ7_15050, partial [Acidimicrobiia bacterium]